jgi:hypothetical protein
MRTKGDPLHQSPTPSCLPGSDPPLNPHIAWYKKPKPVREAIVGVRLVSRSRTELVTGHVAACSVATTIEWNDLDEPKALASGAVVPVM